MTIQPAIRATYANYRRVPTRKTLQLIFEVPLERAPDVHDTFGEPPVEGSTWVAIALLDPEKMKASSELREALQKSVDIEREKDKEPREWSTIARSQQAGIACSDPGFRLFLAAKGYVVADAETAATAVRKICGVNSRRHFADNPDAGARWDELYSEYQLERRGAIA